MLITKLMQILFIQVALVLHGLFQTSIEFLLTFGYRNLAVSSSNFHRGIDIPAGENTYFLASISANVTYVGFRGSGGYTIILENKDVQIFYYHVSPNFLINVRGLCKSRASYRSSSVHIMFMMY